MDRFLIGTHRNSREFENIKMARCDNSDINDQLEQDRNDLLASPLRNSGKTNGSVMQCNTPQ